MQKESNGFIFNYDEILDMVPTNKIDAITAIEWEFILARRELEFFPIQSSWTVLIGGAWLGTNSFIFAQKVKTVISLEPSKSTYELLVKSCNDNGFKNIIPLKLALWDKNGEEEFLIADASCSSGPVVNWVENKITGKEIVQTITWNSLMTELGKHIDLCIVDLEGSEEKFIDGMTENLPDRLMISGYHPVSPHWNWEQKLKDRGYKFDGHLADVTNVNHDWVYHL